MNLFCRMRKFVWPPFIHSFILIRFWFLKNLHFYMIIWKIEVNLWKSKAIRPLIQARKYENYIHWGNIRQRMLIINHVKKCPHISRNLTRRQYVVIWKYSSINMKMRRNGNSIHWFGWMKSICVLGEVTRVRINLNNSI